jgi:hypothetical protein
MNLGERCDEIVRIIDETLVAVATDAGVDADGRPSPTDVMLPASRSAPVLHRRRWRGGNIRL